MKHRDMIHKLGELADWFIGEYPDKMFTLRLRHNKTSKPTRLEIEIGAQIGEKLVGSATYITDEMTKDFTYTQALLTEFVPKQKRAILNAIAEDKKAVPTASLAEEVVDVPTGAVAIQHTGTKTEEASEAQA